MLNKLKGGFLNFLGKIWAFLQLVFSKIAGFVKRHKIISIIIAIILIIAVLTSVMSGKRKNDAEQSTTEATVSKMTISETVSGSSVVEANDEYSVVPLVTGEILSADFEEGDIVQKDQVLYKIDSSSVETKVKSADLSVEKAQTAYKKALGAHTDDISASQRQSANLSLQQAQNSYNQALKSVGDLTVTASVSGTVSDVYVSNGDNVAVGTKVADIIDNNIMKVRVPFNTSDAANIHTGEAAEVTLVNTGTVIPGVITAVSSGSSTVNGSMKVSYVTIEVQNPGAVMEGDSVTAMVGDIACNDVGVFEASEKRSVLAKVGGTVSGVWVVKGDYVMSGSAIVQIESDSVDSQMESAELALRSSQVQRNTTLLQQQDTDDYSAQLKSARLSLDDAILQRDQLYEQLDDYTIKSPISGTVVTKNKKAGDKIEGGSATAAADSNILAVVYDMSSFSFQLDVDELDVKKVEVGQEVEITADAVEGKKYTGIVENVSVNGTVGTNGVTTYPVKVRIRDFDDNLLPGMNVEAVITVDEASDVIAVPVNAVNRGNTVYVKGDKTDDTDRAPEGYRTVSVETGISNDMFVEIISGLNEGDTVYVTPVAGDNQQMMMFGPGGGMPGGGMGGAAGGPPSGVGNRAGGAPGGGGR